jgi:hypothetical protein
MGQEGGRAVEVDLLAVLVAEAVTGHARAAAVSRARTRRPGPFAQVLRRRCALTARQLLNINHSPFIGHAHR